LLFASGPAPDLVLFESATTLRALLGEHQNTVRDVIATNGTVENHLVYNSYGELKSQTGGGAYSPFHRFTGKPFDVAVGLPAGFFQVGFEGQTMAKVERAIESVLKSDAR
jgi:hypothetical protein